jgi:hypothetical protein|tara:strand:+ start:280038 stop:280325 length:288 start_codon:yes stop_codon:yes gene_type:complete
MFLFLGGALAGVLFMCAIIIAHYLRGEHQWAQQLFNQNEPSRHYSSIREVRAHSTSDDVASALLSDMDKIRGDFDRVEEDLRRHLTLYNRNPQKR